MRFDEAPFRKTAFPSCEMRITHRTDGVLILDPCEPLRPYLANLPLELAQWAERGPDKTCLAQRPTPESDWIRCSYAAVKRDADAVAQWLLDHGAERERCLLILSGNSILHAAFKFGAMAARTPVCPVSANYSLLGGDYGRLRHAISLVRPAFIFAEQAQRFGAAVDAVDTGDALIITDHPQLLKKRAVAIEDVLSTTPGPAVAASIEAIDADDASVYMLTSGSTGLPKAVVQSQRMIAANLAQGRQVLGAMAGWSETMLDWLPWSHASGAYTQLGAVTSGGALYIDDGLPTPGLFERSVRNLKEITPRLFVNVPVGYAMLADALEADRELRQRFFDHVQLMLYGGAALPRPLYERIQQLAVDTVGERILFTTGFGATETSSGCMAIYFQTEEPGIGLPMPGLSLKMTPLEDRYELRMKGEMIFRRYLHQPENDRALFDEEGYFRIGDAARFHDPSNVHRGLVYAGRLSEEFKLLTGTWVRAGHLRAQIVQACDPLIADALVCGERRDYVAVLAWPRLEACRKLAGADARESAADVLAHPAVREHIIAGLHRHNEANPSSSTRVRRCAFLLEPPNADAHEVSDKGSINQSLTLRRRAAEVERLYRRAPGRDVLLID